MSARPALRPLAALARRQLRTVPAAAQEAQSGPSRLAQSPSPSTPSSFDALNATFGAPSSTASSELSSVPPPISLSTPAPVSRHAVTRGYSPFALPPPVDPTIELFTNMIMFDGKKQEAQTRMSRVMILLQETTNQPALPLIHKAINLIAPSVRIKTLRKAIKSTLQPSALNERQKAHAGIAWILKASERGVGYQNKWEQRIVREILAILEGDSVAFKWLEERHRQATLNRANIEGSKYGY